MEWVWWQALECTLGRADGATHGNEAHPVPLDLSQYEPRSMLQVHESHVERSRFPLIDFHTHISGSTKSEKGVELRQIVSTWELPKNCWR